MFLYGDELKFSKNGNNNTYCHDNKLNWFDWSLYRKNKKFFNFCKNMIEFRKSHPVLRRATFFNGINSDEYCSSDISWHGFEIGKPDWSENSHCLAFMLNGNKAVTGADLNDNNIYVAINAHWENQNFHLPTPAKKKYWHLAVDTSTSTGFKTPGKETRVKTSIITVPARSITILIDK
ncbi:MAG: alpha amylase C-terminal domain-containing protein, partial [Spirochaetales bacterium]|nr:alpha amylase C-terminal domain-containing protein [Spirochaetales bacterium]